MKRAHNKNFDQHIREKLEHASVEPPSFVWDKIERQLPPVQPWYEKYKYLLLLLLLSFTSATSILVYKNVAMDKAIAQLKRTYVNGNKTSSNTTATTENNNIQRPETNPTLFESQAANGTENAGTATALPGFYSNNGDTSKSTSKELIAPKSALQIFMADKARRMQRMEVKPEATHQSLSPDKIAAQQTTAYTAATDNTTVGDEYQNANAASEVSYSSTGNTSDLLSDPVTANASQVAVSAEKMVVQDVTVPIVQPFYTEVFPLTVSLDPTTPNMPPLSGKDVLRSMIEPQKLEVLDAKMQQAVSVTDLNPKRDKMLKNLKHFNGYNINQGFHVGAFIGINNNWLSKKEFSADENTQSLKPVFHFGKSYGVNIGYDFSNRWGVQLEWQISEQGQRYKEVQDRGSVYRDVQLLYTKFPVMMKYKQTFINNYNAKPVTLSLLFGPQITYLLKQKILVDGQLAPLAPSYNKAEFGVAAGMDIDLYMSRNLYMTIGARTGFSTSMRKDKPMQYQIGLLTQFNFRVPKKIK